MAISSKAVTPTPKATPAPAPVVFTPSTGQYSLAAAQATGYTGGGSSTPAPVSTGKTLAQIQAEAAAKRAANNGLILENYGTGYTQDEKDSSDSYTNKGTQYQVQGANGQFYTAPTRTEAINKASAGGTTAVYTPTSPVISTPVSTGNKLNLSPIQKTQVGNVVGAFKSALASSKGDRASYNASINYDGMNERRKKVADNYFDKNSKSKKEDDLVADPYIVLTDREKAIAEENKKQQELLDQQKKDAEAEALANQQETQRNIDEQSGLISTERDTTISEQEALAKNAEDNRLNQLRGNIMTRLAQRGVDISKLSPEQITALSGEEGAKAFMDVADIKDKKVKAIESVRQSALSKLNELRDKKSINQSAYTSRVNEINSKTAAAKLQADKEFSANVFSLAQTKDQQSRADALARVNAAQTYLTAAGVSGSTAANVIANLSSRGLPDATIQSIAKDPKVIEYLKKVEASNLAQAALDNQLKLGKLSLEQYKAETGRISANRPRSSGGGKLGEALSDFLIAQL